MNTHTNLVIIKDKVVTSSILFIKRLQDGKTSVTYSGQKEYTFKSENVIWLTNPRQIPLTDKQLQLYEEVLEFSGNNKKYYHIFLVDKTEYDFNQTYPLLNYLKECASISALISKETDTKLLPAQYAKLNQIDKESALYKYIQCNDGLKTQSLNDIIFPFGCNQSQISAVKKALENQISIIQGPPGTGKTQTILNIIANLLLQHKSVLIVSNNNTALENIAEKLDKYNLKFLTAKLGRKENKDAFISNQNKNYPQELLSWRHIKISKEKTSSDYLRSVVSGFERKEKISETNREYDALEIEKKHFEKYVQTQLSNIPVFKNKVSSSKIASLWQKLQNEIDLFPEKKEKRLSFFQRFYYSIAYGIENNELLKGSLNDFIIIIQWCLYQTKERELLAEISSLNKLTKKDNTDSLIKDFSAYSMDKLKDSLFNHYCNLIRIQEKQKFERTVYTYEDVVKESEKFVQEFPITLSTTFSSKNNLSTEFLYDYVIMDEASQVDIATGALALSSAKNAVIVGDSLQLPNVVTSKDKAKLELIYDIHKSKIANSYNSAKYSFLDSIIKSRPSVPQTLLKEHYRCHPKIIEFCSQKFYNGQLIAMTTDQGEKDVLNIIKTVKGNHCREDHINQRQIDCLTNEVIPLLAEDKSNIGIICPYKNQVEQVKKEVPSLAESTATVHKFQGREKDAIIFMTTDDTVTSFSDDANLLNVAISRAKNKFFLVTSDNRQPANSNIRELISYIEYTNGNVFNSKIHSVFDYLYKQYCDSRIEFLKQHKKISEFDSENLMYSVIEVVLEKEQFNCYGVVCHQPLNQLISDYSLITDSEELKYAQHPSTHLDFMIYKKITKEPFLAIEIDGYSFHQQGTKQAERDSKKNHILSLYHIPLVRYSTRESEISKKLESKMNELLVAAGEQSISNEANSPVL